MGLSDAVNISDDESSKKKKKEKHILKDIFKQPIKDDKFNCKKTKDDIKIIKTNVEKSKKTEEPKITTAEEIQKENSFIRQNYHKIGE